MTKTTTAKLEKPPYFGKLTVGLLVGITLIIGSILLVGQPVSAADIVVYKSPTCGCCTGWARHMRENGFGVETHDRSDMSPVKEQLGVPRHLHSCHTAKIGNYVIEGHVPANDIKRLLSEKPGVAGLAVPGMPMGSPGMEGPREDPYEVLTFTPDGKISTFARHNQ